MVESGWLRKNREEVLNAEWGDRFLCAGDVWNSWGLVFGILASGSTGGRPAFPCDATRPGKLD
jgi:hypothetical protein